MSNQPKFVFIIQARTGSSRLPGKMIKPFYENLTIPEIIAGRLKNFFPNIPIIVATSNSEKDDVLAKKMLEAGFEVHRGDEEDVLRRFLTAVNKKNHEVVIRVCADNPFLDVDLIQDLMVNWTSEMDYLAHQINGLPSMKTAYGFFAELTTINALEKVSDMTDEMFYHEHVTNYIYGNTHQFNVNWVQVDTLISDNTDVRLTVDTSADFDSAQVIYKDLVEGNKPINYLSILEYLKSHNFTDSMRKENLKNAK